MCDKSKQGVWRIGWIYDEGNLQNVNKDKREGKKVAGRKRKGMLRERDRPPLFLNTDTSVVSSVHVYSCIT